RTILARRHWTGDAQTPAVSPDGTTVLYTRSNSSLSRPSFGRSLWVVGIDGSGNHRITPWRLGGGDHPGFAPDGTILFRSYEEDDTKQSDFWTVRPTARRSVRSPTSSRGRPCCRRPTRRTASGSRTPSTA